MAASARSVARCRASAVMGGAGRVEDQRPLDVSARPRAPPVELQPTRVHVAAKNAIVVRRRKGAACVVRGGGVDTLGSSAVEGVQFKAGYLRFGKSNQGLAVALRKQADNRWDATVRSAQEPKRQC